MTTLRFACRHYRLAATSLLVLLAGLLFMPLGLAQEGSILTAEEQAYVDAHPSVLVGVVANNEPYTFWVDGELRGLSVDILREIEARTGLRFEFRAGSWSEVYRSFREGQLDLLSEISLTEARQAFTLFTEPFHLRNTVLFENADNPLVDYQGFPALTGKKIGIIRDIYYRDRLQAYDGIEIAEYDNYADLVKSLAFGWLDGVVIGRLTGEYLAREQNLPNLRVAGALGIPGLEVEDYRLGVAHDQPLLYQIINKGLSAIPETQRGRMVERWQLYGGRAKPTARALELTDQERAFIHQHPALKAGILQDYEPFSFLHQGQVHGYSVDLLEQISRTIGIRFEPVTGTWANLLEQFRQGELDIIANISRNQERQAYTLFTRDYYRIPNVIFVRDDFGPYNGLENLSGKRVGITRGVFYADRLARRLDQELVQFDASEEMMKALSFGRIDAVATALNTGNTQVRSQGLMNIEIAGELLLEGVDYEDLRFGIKPALPELHGLIEKGFDALPIESVIKLQNRWLSARGRPPEPSKIMLTGPERAYIKAKGSLRFCSRMDWMPYESVAQGVHSGMASDLLTLLANRGGIRFERVATASWAESVAAVQRGDCDLLPMAMDSRTRNDSLDYTTPYLQVPGVVATAIDTPFFDDFREIARQPLGILAGEQYAAELRRQHPDIKLVPVADLAEGIRQVQRGTLFGLVGALSNLSHQIQKQRITDIKISGRLPEPWQLSIATRGDQPELHSIMQRLVDSLDEEEWRQIESRWLAMPVEQGVDQAMLWKTLLAILLVMTGVAYWNRKLRRLNQRLAEANDRLHELNRQDPLTGLHNRMHFSQRLADLLQLSQRNGLPLSVAMIDIDHFKAINDTHGHLAGDTCLREFGKLLSEHFQRGSDVVARYGGEEFTVVTLGLDVRQLEHYLECLRRRVAAHSFTHEDSPPFHITISVGATVTTPSLNQNGADFLALADEALYQAKEEGRDRIVIRDNALLALA